MDFSSDFSFDLTDLFILGLVDSWLTSGSGAATKDPFGCLSNSFTNFLANFGDSATCIVEKKIDYRGVGSFLRV